MSARSETTTLPGHTTSTAPDTVPSTINQTSATGRTRASGESGDTSYNSRLSKAPSSIEKLRAEQAKRAKAAAAAQATAAESSDSESDYDAGGSSDEDGGSVSSAASSVGPSSPPGSSRFDSFVSGPKKKKVQVGHGIPPQKKEVASIWPDEMGEEERLAMLKEHRPDWYEELMGMTDAERKRGLKDVKQNIENNIAMQQVAAQATTEATAATKLNPVDLDVAKDRLRYYMERVTDACVDVDGFVTAEDRDNLVRQALHDYVSTNYSGSLNDLEWPEPWKEKAKAPSTLTLDLLTKEDRETHREKYWLPMNKDSLRDRQGNVPTIEEARAHYDKNINPKQVTLDCTDDIWSKFSALAPKQTTAANGNTYNFDTLTQDQLTMLKAMKAIEDEGGTQAEVEQRWQETYATRAMPEVKITDTAVTFYNAQSGTIMTGEMPDGTVVTHSCRDTGKFTAGQGSAVTRQTKTVDTSGRNPLYHKSNPELANKWNSIRTEHDKREKKRKQDEKEAAETAATAKAVAAKEARIRPVAAKNGATSLADVPTRDTTKGTDCLTWNGLDIAEWQKNGRDTTKLSEAAATSLYNRALTLAKFEHLRPAGTDDQTAVEIASWVADGQSSRLVGDYLKARDIPFDSATWDKVTGSKSRPETWTDQKIRDWATNSSALKDTKFKDSQALDRMNMLASAQKRWPCQSRAQSYKVGSAFADQFYLMSHDDKSGDIKSWYPALQKTFSEKLKEVPSWTPTKDEVW